jgi:hypothetical protein
VIERDEPSRLDGFGMPFEHRVEKLTLVGEVVERGRMISLAGSRSDFAHRWVVDAALCEKAFGRSQ